LFNENKLIYKAGPPTKTNGMYWIYTDYTNDELLNSTPCLKRGSIDFAKMVINNQKINGLCSESVDDFRLVYSGIGGVGSAGAGGLRERILEEFRGGEGTGSLAINCSSLSVLTRWRVSYVLWSEVSFPKIYEYRPFSTAVEGLWRLHYGWPILCTK